MILTPHIIIGVVIGLKTQNPWIGFFAGLTSHFILDIIPHTEYGQEDSGKKIKEMHISTILKALLDITVALSLVYIAFITKPLSINLWAILGSVLPDIISIVSWQYPNKFFSVLNKFHYFHTKKNSVKLGTITQIIISTAGIILFSIYK